MTDMTSSRPYLIRAFYDWISENKCTPYVVIDAEAKNVQVPRQYIDGGRIILNISMGAVQDLQLTNEKIEFSATFAGMPFMVYAPATAILAIYAQENGRGMVFNEEEEDSGTTQPPTPPAGGDKPSKNASHLRVVK